MKDSKNKKLKITIENEIKTAMQQIANKYNISFSISVTTSPFNNNMLLEQTRESKHFCNIREDTK